MAPPISDYAGIPPKASRLYCVFFTALCFQLGPVWKPSSPQGSPSFPRAGSPRGILSRGVQHAPLEARSVGVFDPGEPNNLVESRPTYTHGEKSPSLVSLRGVARSSSIAPPPPTDLLRRSRDGRSPPLVSLQPLHPSYQVIPPPPSPSPFISLPLLGFLLSSPLIFFL